MTHARQKIREAIARLLAANPVAWKSVTESRIASTRQIWPYLMVFADGELSEQIDATDPGVYDRTVTINVAGMLKLPGTGDTYTIEDRMDECAAEIETRLTQSALRAEVQIGTMALTSTGMEVILEDDGIDHAEVILSYQISYTTQEGLPGSFI